MLLSTANKSILVVEDIDCTIEFQNRLSFNPPPVNYPYDMHHQDGNKVTLSGFLNFIDGKMDVHIHMSYCTPCGFKILAANYLDIKDHFLFKETENLIATTEVTPAEVAEQLLRDDQVDVVLQGLIDFLHVKRKKMRKLKLRKWKLR
ncbi:OLC1v1010916C1 [Oldenlandia corymbosa var. corymbosa]|uniref:OLC1v1010916C1 n=1 Tax=Oldenlandia corymbosa var. corymbosa TaxID=529605 RepID=A0AAV1DUT9_OLDCO|nr:OLC1v1010916C1 [Oldenlandia corymbosa var. corymbosa]